MNWLADVLMFLAILIGVLMLGMVNNDPGFGAVAGGMFVAAGLFFLAGTQWRIAERFGRPGPRKPDAEAGGDEKQA